MVCRLCLSEKLLIDTFDDQLSNSKTLRRDILIITGVKISETDKTTSICQKCREIIVAISKFRQNTQANDAILRKNRGRKISLPSSYREKVNELGSRLLNLLTTKERERSSEESGNSRHDVVPIDPTVSHPDGNTPQEILDEDKVEVNSCKSESNESNRSALDKIEVKSNSSLGSACSIRTAKVKTKRDDDTVSIFSKSGPGKNGRELATILKELENCFESDEAEFSCDESSFIAIESSGESEEIEDDNYSFAPSLVKPIKEQVLLNCEYCNRIFKSKYHLTTHQRTHKRCEICNGIFRSDKILKRHQREVCFKNLAANLPSVVITRCDKQPKATDRKEAKNPTNEVQVPNEEADDEVIFMGKYDANDLDVSNEEKRHISGIFEKYASRVQKDFSSGTEPQLFTRYGRGKEIIVGSFLSDLNYYRIPIKFIASKMKSFHVAYGEDPKGREEIFSWSDMPVITLKNAGRQSTSNPANNIESSVNLKRKCPSNPHESDIYVKQKKLPSRNPNILSNLANRKVVVESSNGKAVSLPLKNAKIIFHEEIPNLMGQYVLEWNGDEAVPGTSSGNNFNLRVKSPDELNKFLCNTPFTI